MPAGVLLSLIIFAKPTQRAGFFVLSIVEIFQFADYFEYRGLFVQRNTREIRSLQFWRFFSFECLRNMTSILHYVQ